MKKINLFAVALCFMLSFGAQAQIFKKMQKAIEEKAQRSATDRSEEKTTESKGFNPGSMAMGYGKNKVDASLVPDSYDFSWKYSMKVTTDKGKETTMDYFLEPNAEYVGSSSTTSGSSNMFMVMDNKNKLMVMAFGKGDNKMASASKMPDYSKTPGNTSEKYTKFTYKTLPDKVIMGYKCKGVQATNASYEMKFYYTNEAKVSFANVFNVQQHQGKSPDFLKGFFKPNEKPLMMMMGNKDMETGKVTTMECVALNKESKTFKKADYKFM